MNPVNNPNILLFSLSNILLSPACAGQLWDTERPDGTITMVHSSSMRQFNWGYTQFSQFNADDTLLLVSGVYLGSHHSSSGEIAVISLGRTHTLSPAVSHSLLSPSLSLFLYLLFLLCFHWSFFWNVYHKPQFYFFKDQ